MVVWNNRKIKNLVEIRHDVEYVDKFGEPKNNGYMIRLLWKEIAFAIDEELTGQEVSDKYKYLLKKFKLNNLKAKTSGECAIKWPHYNVMKEYLFSEPSIYPIVLVETSDLNLI
jgi:hypothetical protein